MKGSSKLLIGCAIATMTLTAILTSNPTAFSLVSGRVIPDHTFTVNEAVTTSDTFGQVTYTLPTNNLVKLSFESVKAGGGVGTIQANSKVEKLNGCYGLNAITVDFTGPLNILTKYEATDTIQLTVGSNFKPHGAENGIVSGQTYVIEGNYFELVAGNADVVINSITVDYACEEAEKDVRPSAGLSISGIKNAYIYNDALHGKHYYEIEASVTGEGFFDEGVFEIFHEHEKTNYYTDIVDARICNNGTEKSILVRFDVEEALKAPFPQWAPHYPHLYVNGTGWNGTNGDLALSGKYYRSNDYAETAYSESALNPTISLSQATSDGEWRFQYPYQASSMYFWSVVCWNLPCIVRTAGTTVDHPGNTK